MPRTSKLYRSILVFLALLSLVVACSGKSGICLYDEGGCNEGGGVVAPGATSQLLGFARDPSGAKLANVTVTVGSVSATTDGNGRFELTVPSMTVAVARFERAGHAPSSVRIDPGGAAITSVDAVLWPYELESTVDVTSSDASVSVQEATVSFPQGSIVTASGDTPSGPVDIQMTYVSRAEASNAPLELIGRDGDTIERLQTFGMVEITLSYQGEPANIAPGAFATLSIDSLPMDPPDAGLFYGDLAQGLWVFEGDASNDGTSWSVQLPHLSWINIDAFLKVPASERGCVRFTTTAPDGTPIGGVRVNAEWQPGRLQVRGNTNRDGVLCSDSFQSGVPIAVEFYTVFGLTSRSARAGATTTIATQGGACDGDCTDVELSIACVRDDQCDEGDQCIRGICTIPCSTNDDCAGGFTCVQQACLPPDTPPLPTFVGSWRRTSLYGVADDPTMFTLNVTVNASLYYESHIDAASGTQCFVSWTVSDVTPTKFTITVASTDCANYAIGAEDIQDYSLSADNSTWTFHDTEGDIVFSRLQ